MHPEIQAVGSSTLGLGSGAESPEIIQTICEKNGKWRAKSRPCRSWLASEEALTVNEHVDWKNAFAGKPAPTEGLLGISERCC
jgi:hypothetical protein